jgi:3-oxoacyl-(acyl-carrier-protein) synthase
LTRLNHPRRGTANRPFDRDRSVPSLKAAVAPVLEKVSALNRGAPVCAEITGFAFLDAHSMRPWSRARAAERMLRAAL